MLYSSHLASCCPFLSPLGTDLRKRTTDMCKTRVGGTPIGSLPNPLAVFLQTTETEVMRQQLLRTYLIFFPKCDQISKNQIYSSIKTTWIYSYQRNIIFICQIRHSGKLLFKSFMKTIVGSQKDMIKFYFVHFLLCGVDPFNWEPGGREPGGGVPPNVAGSSI